MGSDSISRLSSALHRKNRAQNFKKSRTEVGISIIKGRDSRDVLSDFRLRKRHKQTKFSLNNNITLPWKGNTNINVQKEELQLK